MPATASGGPRPPDGALSIGIDFGTTNTVLAICREAGDAEIVRFRHDEEWLDVFRSALCFWDERRDGAAVSFVEAGPWAIDRYLDAPFGHRFLQSFKTYAASRSFSYASIQGRRWHFEDLMSTFLGKALARSGVVPAAGPVRIVAGRPVAFAGQSPDDALAIERYDKAFANLGLGAATYVYEPVGAASFFAQRLDATATVLVADFGGGTSDFSVIRFEIGRGRRRAVPLGSAGVGIAGDTFDYRILDHAISPQLGKDGLYRSTGKLLRVPSHYFASFARWNQLALMKSATVMRELDRLIRDAVEPAGLDTLRDIIDLDLGFALYRAVSDVKIALSTDESARFDLTVGDRRITADVSRADFERWIAPDLARIAAAVDQALADAALPAAAIDQVFLTGGSSFIPAVRDIFAALFGAERLATGNQLDSIAHGLALVGHDPDLARWAATG